MKTIKNILIYLIATSSIISTCQRQTVTLFSHGIADTWKQIYQYLPSYTKKDIVFHNAHHTINKPFVSFNYPDATSRFYRVNYHETSFGQANEIGRLYSAYKQTIKKFGNDCDIILYGLSRGAANVIIFAGSYQLDHVKALVLESPYYTMSEVIYSIMKKKNLEWLPLSYGESIAETIFKRYTRYGTTPAGSLENIPKEMPILIICSQEDHLVPAESSINVYKKLIESGHEHTYIFITNQGRHAAILSGPDGEKYEQVVNAFYKKYNLPYSAENAALGEPLLAQCQPTFE